MTKVPELNLPRPKLPETKMIVCTTDGKPLHPDDQKALEEYIEYRIKKSKESPNPTRSVE